MKHFSLLILAAVLAVAAPVSSARAEVDVSIDFFYDALSPHGDWIYADDYGYVFQPIVAQTADWAPYTDGYWAYTDAGWTWISNEDFGWATYHYGRWIQMQGGWVWVPGTEWAPAWVSWRQTDDHVGWAPLPPEASWSVNIGFNQWSDSYYDIGPSWYNFVPFNLFARRTSLRPVIVNRSRNITYINSSVNVTNISYRQNVVNNIFVGGPDPDRFDRGDNRIRRLSLRRDEDRFRRDWIDNRSDRPRSFDSLSRIESNQLIVAAPSVRGDRPAGLPSRVRERFERPEIDRGWRDAGDSQAAEALRERQRAAFAKAKPAELPERKAVISTSKIPPPAIGRLLKPEERRGGGQRPDPRQVDEDVRKGLPPGAADKSGNRPGMRDEPPGPGDTRRPGMADRDGRPGERPEGRPGMPDRDSRPGERPEGRPGMPDRDGLPGERPEGRPGMPDRDGRPGERPEGRPGMPDRDGRPGERPEGRPGMPDRDGRPGERPGSRPDMIPGSRVPEGKPDERPGMSKDGPDRRPGVKPEEAPRPRLAPGVVPSDEDRRRGGVPSAPSSTPSRTQNEPPSAAPERTMPTPPKSRPELPKVNPNSPGNRPDRPFEGRPGKPSEDRPSPSTRPSQARPTPMPEPKATPNARPSPMPRPEQPKAKPVPMPTPKARPPQSSKGDDKRLESPSIRMTKPQSAPQRPAPQVKKESPAAKPQVKSAPPTPKPQVKKTSPKPEAKSAAPKPQVKSAPPKAKPQGRPTADRSPSGKKQEERRKKD